MAKDCDVLIVGVQPLHLVEVGLVCLGVGRIDHIFIAGLQSGKLVQEFADLRGISQRRRHRSSIDLGLDLDGAAPEVRVEHGELLLGSITLERESCIGSYAVLEGNTRVGSFGHLATAPYVVNTILRWKVGGQDEPRLNQKPSRFVINRGL